MSFKTTRRIILALDIVMVVTALAAVTTHLMTFWIVTALLCFARMYLYLRPLYCPHCRKIIRPDRSISRCPHCGERIDGKTDNPAE